MQKFLEVLKKIGLAIYNGLKFIVVNFFKIFNTKTKVAAIALTAYIWYTLNLNLTDKIGAFILFGVLMLLISYIAKESK